MKWRPSCHNRAAELGREKGAHSWVTALPITTHGFTLRKGAFRDTLCLWYKGVFFDALCLLYNWISPNIPSECVCGVTFTVEHALLYPIGGVTISCYNEVHDLMAGLLTDICHNVCIEPRLQPLSSEATTHSTTTDSTSLQVVFVVEDLREHYLT